MFSRIGNLIYRSSESKNSASYVNRQSLNLTLDPSGTDFIEYSTDSAYFTDAHSLIPNSESQTTTTALKLQDSATPANNFFLSSLGDFTLCVKHKLNASSTSSDIFSHYFANPQYDISFAEPYIRENSPFNVIVSKASNGPVEYEVSGNLIASDLSNGDISGTLSTVESVLPYTLNTGTGGNDFVFSLKNFDVSLNAPIYSQYYVASSTNILGETVFAFSPTGTEGTYNNQLDLSFGANSKMIFNVADNTMTDFSLVFGTTVDDSTSINESVVTRTNDLVILDISAGYDGDRLVYFEDSSAGMGYVPGSSITIDTSTDIDVTFNTANASASNYGGSFTPDLAFNNNYTQGDSWITYWSSPNRYDTGDNYPGPNNTIVDNVTISGEWLQMDFGSEKYIGKFTLSTYNDWDDVNTGFMTEFVIAGSSDGSNFTEIGTYNQSNILKSSTSYTSSEITSTNVIASRYIRLIGVKVKINMAIREWQMKEHPLSEGPIYTVAVSSNSFWIQRPEDSGLVEKPTITFNSGTTYIFDQSDSTNANNTLVIGTAPDVSSSIVSSGLTIMGTPGQAGAYTKYVSNGSTVYYFSYQTENMGAEPLTYTVKVVDHEVTGEKIFSIQAPGTSTFINQPDLSFGAGDRYQFDVTDDTMADISLVFGTTVDDSTSINETVVTRYEGMILLDISAGYDGERLVYFEDSSAGMGYYFDSGSSSLSSTLYKNTEALTPAIGDTISRMEPATDVSNLTITLVDNIDYPFANGDYTITLSSRYNNSAVFTNVTTLAAILDESDPTESYPWSQYMYWEFRWPSYTQATNGTPTEGSPTTTASNGISYTGEYIQLVMPYKTTLESTNLMTREGNTTYQPNEFVLLGKNSGSSTFDYIGTRSGITFPTDGTQKTFTFNSTTPYDTYRIVVTRANGYVQMGIWSITGYPMIPSVPETYTVTVDGDPAVFYLDNESGPTPKPAIDFANNNGTTYVFDQSDSTNTGNTLIIGTAFDDPASIVSSGLTIVGTPGQPGAYTKYVSNGSTVYYFSYQTSNMGYNPTP